jgi:hypothetical protein
LRLLPLQALTLQLVQARVPFADQQLGTFDEPQPC